MVESGRWDWWRDFVGMPETSVRRALKILNENYLLKTQHAELFRQHATHMPYPQFRGRLLEIAGDEMKHAQWIAEKIRLLGGKLPDVPTVSDMAKSSWGYLKDDLTAEENCVADLIEQAHSLRDEFPGVADLLERIHRESVIHRESLRQMLMRADPQSQLAP